MKSESHYKIMFLKSEYLSNLKDIEHLLSTGGKPTGIHHTTFTSYKPLLENLIEKRQLKKSALEIFPR